MFSYYYTGSQKEVSTAKAFKHKQTYTSQLYQALLTTADNDFINGQSIIKSNIPLTKLKTLVFQKEKCLVHCLRLIR